MHYNTKEHMKIVNKLTKRISLKQEYSLPCMIFNICIEHALERCYNKCGRMIIPILGNRLIGNTFLRQSGCLCVGWISYVIFDK